MTDEQQPKIGRVRFGILKPDGAIEYGDELPVTVNFEPRETHDDRTPVYRPVHEITITYTTETPNRLIYTLYPRWLDRFMGGLVRLVRGRN